MCPKIWVILLPSILCVCLFVWIGGRGPVLGTGSGRGVPLRDFADAKLPGEALPWFLWFRGTGRER